MPNVNDVRGTRRFSNAAARHFGLAGVLAGLVALTMAASFVLVFGVLFVSCLGNVVWADDQRQHAEDEARIWISEMYPEESAPHIVCQAQDTDRNGYVTCNARLSDDTHLNLECYAWILWNPGQNTCREVIPIRGYTSR